MLPPQVRESYYPVRREFRDLEDLGLLSVSLPYQFNIETAKKATIYDSERGRWGVGFE